MCNSSKLFIQKSTRSICHSVLERDLLFPHYFIINDGTNCLYKYIYPCLFCFKKKVSRKSEGNGGAFRVRIGTARRGLEYKQASSCNTITAIYGRIHFDRLSPPVILFRCSIIHTGPTWNNI